MESANGLIKENPFDTNLLVTQRMLDKLERKHLLADGDVDEAV